MDQGLLQQQAFQTDADADKVYAREHFSFPQACDCISGSWSCE